MTSSIRCFTSVNNCYLPKARVLAESVKAHHPDWQFDLVLSDTPIDPFDLEKEPFDTLLTLDQLGVENWQSWAFMHRVVELCTATKGMAAMRILEEHNPNFLIYLDPDTAVFNSMDNLIDLLHTHPLILTPHQLCPETELPAIIDNEICSLKHGIFNLGFFAVKNAGQGRDFIQWWNERLLHFCYDDIPSGLFTDQKWCDHAPVFFDQLHILRKSNYNVATWNLAHRDVAMGDDGTILVDGRPLRFYHFTGYDSGAGATMLAKYASSNTVVNELWDWYARQLERHGQEQLGRCPWAYSVFDNGEKIENAMRRLYRDRKDLQISFPDPFDTSREDGGFLAWWQMGHDR
ncbi:hypothetical protein [Pseudodesulfovibrio sediminis]|uniref:Glycosyl transferase n=1 Tax=Pseudodesulfovibrio sediminis TaxID=2810563 RepID=A0ABN6ES60_9BACT|nr:hypothetical protein [Pseudodesulfovibrio sediminis]BCS87981.1 hypothetical protein PSDVSF_12230 [Pseudodesulfovibrio sediminis]